jgi:hypothetical protein
MSADGISYELTRVRLGDGRETTVYLVRYPRAVTSVRLVCFSNPRRLDRWCADHGHPEAIVAGFFVRDPYRPLGEVRIGGQAVNFEPIAPPWGPLRGCVHIDGEVRLAARRELAADPTGDLVMAGPMLVADGRSLMDEDREGFSAGSAQFDSDITAERHPRCALGVCERQLLAVACDGRRRRARSRRARPPADLLWRRGRDQPRRRGIGHFGASRPSPQPALFEPGSARARVAARCDRPSVRAALVSFRRRASVALRRSQGLRSSPSTAVITLPISAG